MNRLKWMFHGILVHYFQVLKHVSNCMGVELGGFCFRILFPNLSSEETEQERDAASQCCLSNLTKN